MLEFGCAVFHPNKKNGVVLLETIQITVTRRVFIREDSFLHSRIRRDSIVNSYLGLHTLESRRKLRDACIVFKLCGWHN